MEKVRPCWGQPSDRGWLKNRAEHVGDMKVDRQATPELGLVNINTQIIGKVSCNIENGT